MYGDSTHGWPAQFKHAPIHRVGDSRTDEKVPRRKPNQPHHPHSQTIAHFMDSIPIRV
jgi:hypothetical protein